MTWLIFIVICCLFRAFHFSPQCLDENSKPVDWFALYKIPYLKGHSNYNIANGTGYVYITSETVKNGWTLSKFNISDPRSIPAKTLNPLYSNVSRNDVKDIFWILYNDQPPNEPYTKKEGHTKGVVLGDRNGGIWLVHSVPRFPFIGEYEYRYPVTAHKYGQSFLCITLNNKNLETIGGQLIVNEANTFKYKFEGNLENVYPALFSAAKKVRENKVTSKIQFHSIGNVLFTSFAKSSDFNDDLYSKWVAGALESDLFVETWLHEHKLPPVCNSTYKTRNIERIKFPKRLCDFSNMLDHSKFAVSGNNKNFVCIGDINRDFEQFIRAGGTVCFEDKYLWEAYIRLVKIADKCPKLLE